MNNLEMSIIFCTFTQVVKLATKKVTKKVTKKYIVIY